MGPNSPVEPDVLKGQLRQIQQQGYAICIDEMHENVVSIAVPVRDYTEDVVAAVTIVGTRDRIDDAKIDAFIERMAGAADEISKRLGYILRQIGRS